jgi:hypothetical protein
MDKFGFIVTSLFLVVNIHPHSLKGDKSVENAKLMGAGFSGRRSD